jgi:hypothetical protein
MAVRDLERKLKKMEADIGVKKIEMVTRDGSTVEFDVSLSGSIMLDSLLIMNAVALGIPVPDDSAESLPIIRQWAGISDEELERHPEYRWTVGLARQCLEAKPLSIDEKMALEKSCAGSYFESLEKNGKLMLQPGKRPDIKAKALEEAGL